MSLRNYKFYAWQHLTGQISMREFTDLVLAMNTISFDYEAIERRITMPEFKVGDKVRLKDSPYKGVIEEGVQGWAYARFRLADGNQITVSHVMLLEHDIDPQPGDIYEDKNGNEWVIIKQRGWSHHPEDMIAARPIEYTDQPGYPHSTLALTKPESIAQWADQYGPKLVRRRDA